MRARLALLLVLARVSAQPLIGMTFCAPPDCFSNCKNWLATAGQCLPCDGAKGPCSSANPSFLVSEKDLKLYSDASCTQQSQSWGPLPIVIDGTCRALPALKRALRHHTTPTRSQPRPSYPTGTDNAVYSYKAVNISGIIG